MNRIYFLLFVFLCFTSCDEKHKYELYPSNERYISVSTFNDSIILDYQDSCDTLIRVGAELYDVKGTLFFTTKKDTLLFLDSIEKGLKRSINHVKGKKEYTSSTYKGSWIDKSMLFTITFDEKGNILKIFRPFYIINYIADRNNVQPIKQNTRHRKFYYPKADELWHYEFIYDEKNILMRRSQKMKFDTLYYKVGEIYNHKDGLLLSNRKDTTITNLNSATL